MRLCCHCWLPSRHDQSVNKSFAIDCGSSGPVPHPPCFTSGDPPPPPPPRGLITTPTFLTTMTTQTSPPCPAGTLLSPPPRPPIDVEGLLVLNHLEVVEARAFLRWDLDSVLVRLGRFRGRLSPEEFFTWLSIPRHINVLEIISQIYEALDPTWFPSLEGVEKERLARIADTYSCGPLVFDHHTICFALNRAVATCESAAEILCLLKSPESARRNITLPQIIGLATSYAPVYDARGMVQICTRDLSRLKEWFVVSLDDTTRPNNVVRELLNQQERDMSACRLRPGQPRESDLTCECLSQSPVDKPDTPCQIGPALIGPPDMASLSCSQMQRSGVSGNVIDAYVYFLAVRHTAIINERRVLVIPTPSVQYLLREKEKCRGSRSPLVAHWLRSDPAYVLLPVGIKGSSNRWVLLLVQRRSGSIIIFDYRLQEGQHTQDPKVQEVTQAAMSLFDGGHTSSIPVKMPFNSITGSDQDSGFHLLEHIERFLVNPVAFVDQTVDQEETLIRFQPLDVADWRREVWLRLEQRRRGIEWFPNTPSKATLGTPASGPVPRHTARGVSASDSTPASQPSQSSITQSTGQDALAVPPPEANSQARRNACGQHTCARCGEWPNSFYDLENCF